MCKFLKISRSTYYYKENPREIDVALENKVIKEFRKSRNNYGTRKLKKELAKHGFSVSRRKIGDIMRKYNLVSNYTIRQKKHDKSKVNNDDIANVVDRKFDDRKKYEVVVSDLTYINIAGKWCYLCLLLDLCGRRIIGSAVGNHKDAKLVQTAFYSVQVDLRQVGIFHTDRGSEFKNNAIEQILTAFGIQRSLSAKWTPYDNAVAESMYNIVKTEFVFPNEFNTLDDFKLQWFDYVNWYNNVRIHGSLNYHTPNEWHNLS